MVMKTQKAYLNEYYKMLLELDFDDGAEDFDNIVQKQIVQLQDLRTKALLQSGLTEAELSSVCINRLTKDFIW